MRVRTGKAQRDAYDPMPMRLSWHGGRTISFAWKRYTPLHACLAIFLLMAGTGCGSSIHDTVAQGDVSSVKAMLERHPEWAQRQTNRGKTPLHYAVSNGQIDCMNLLVEHGADLNARDHTGMTPLHAAAMLGRVREAEWLLDHGAARDAKDTFGDTPLHTAAVFGQGDMVKMLLERGSDGQTGNAQGKTPQDLAHEHRHPRVAELFGITANSASGSAS